MPKHPIDLLIVDDSPFNILGIETLLKFIPNMTIHKSFNGLDGYKKVKDNYEKMGDGNRYFMIFMDLDMPIMNGIESIKKIREITKFEDYKIISLTANN